MWAYNGFAEYIQQLLIWKYQSFIELYLIKIFESLSIIIVGGILSFFLYKCVIYIFKKFNIPWLINKIELKMQDGVSQNTRTQLKKDWEKNEKTKKIFTQRFQIDQIVAKAISYYIFLLFFRLAITTYWIDDVEAFMDELLRYLPKLFIGAIIWYFGFRFSKFIHDIVYYAFGVKSKETAKLVATGIRGIIIFFTIMAVLDQVWIATEITTTLLNGFIAMLAIAWGLAFWLGGKDVAREILESFRK